MDRIIDRIFHGTDNVSPKIRTRRNSLEDPPHYRTRYRPCNQQKFLFNSLEPGHHWTHFDLSTPPLPSKNKGIMALELLPTPLPLMKKSVILLVYEISFAIFKSLYIPLSNTFSPNFSLRTIEERLTWASITIQRTSQTRLVNISIPNIEPKRYLFPLNSVSKHWEEVYLGQP